MCFASRVSHTFENGNTCQAERAKDAASKHDCQDVLRRTYIPAHVIQVPQSLGLLLVFSAVSSFGKGVLIDLPQQVGILEHGFQAACDSSSPIIDLPCDG